MSLEFLKALHGILQLSLETITLNYQFPHLQNSGENSPNNKELMRHFNKAICYIKGLHIIGDQRTVVIAISWWWWK